jgi:hypothetical protein
LSGAGGERSVPPPAEADDDVWAEWEGRAEEGLVQAVGVGDDPVRSRAAFEPTEGLGAAYQEWKRIGEMRMDECFASRCGGV